MKRSLAPFLSFVFLTLMFFKVSSFHVYTHEDNGSDEIENCELCELAVENSKSETLFTPFQVVELPMVIRAGEKQFALYSQIIISSLIRFQLLSRPPPYLA